MRLQNEINKDLSRYIIRENYNKITVYFHDNQDGEYNNINYTYNGTHTFTSDEDREKILAQMINTMFVEQTKIHKISNNLMEKSLKIYIGF